MSNSFEKIKPQEKTEKNEIEITKEQIAQKIQKMKYESTEKPDAVNLHLKNIDERILFTSLEEEDYAAFKKAFNNEWTEDSKDFQEYEEKVLEWKKRERMDSGASPKLQARRDFAAMIRNYVVGRTAEIKRENKKFSEK